MRRAKRRTTARRRRSTGTKRKRSYGAVSRRSGMGSWATDFIAVLAMRFLGNIIAGILPAGISFAGVPVVPLVIYFLAQRKILPISGLDTVAKITLLTSVSEMILPSGSATTKQGWSSQSQGYGAVTRYPYATAASTSLPSTYGKVLPMRSPSQTARMTQRLPDQYAN